ncbi:MAG: hypothetical protein NT062_20655 [Proteobacteria bacterium]|nr:hypothetical protein [Pseudomonadota bacterium]
MRALVIVVALAGCKPASDGAPCGAVGGQFFKIATDELAAAKDLDATRRRQVHDQLPAMRDSLDTACSDGKWSRPVRDCLAKATDHAGIEACELQLTDAQRVALDKSTRGVDPTP